MDANEVRAIVFESVPDLVEKIEEDMVVELPQEELDKIEALEKKCEALKIQVVALEERLSELEAKPTTMKPQRRKSKEPPD